jgi:hypothetical protein
LDGDPLTGELTTVTGLTPGQVGVALRYYAAYPGEIDECITQNAAARLTFRAAEHVVPRQPART